MAEGEIVPLPLSPGDGSGAFTNPIASAMRHNGTNGTNGKWNETEFRPPDFVAAVIYPTKQVNIG